MTQRLEYIAIILSVGIVALLLRILAKMFYKQWRFGVPFVRTKQEGITNFVKHLTLKPGQIFLDLGCGDGIVMAAVLDRFPGVIARGYELVPKVVNLSMDYQKKYGNKFTIINKDYFEADFSDADVIYCYLLPRLIKPVWDKMKKECKSRTLLYSNVFFLSNIKPIEKIVTNIPGKKDETIYVYCV